MAMSQGVKYAVIGAGIHGLSTAYHLAQMLRTTGRGSGQDILVLDKTSVGRAAPELAQPVSVELRGGAAKTSHVVGCPVGAGGRINR